MSILLNNVFGLTVLGSGSRGNATVVHGPDGCLLIDAGFSAKELRRRLELCGIALDSLRGVLVSHEHGDHVCGLRVLTKQLGIPVYANRQTAEAVRACGQAPEQMHIFASGSRFEAGGFSVEPFSIPHDASDPVGFVIRKDGLKIAVATDLGHVSTPVAYHLAEADLIMVESNHDVRMLHSSRRNWGVKQRALSRHGHLSNDACMALLRTVVRQRTRCVVMAHASGECNDYAIIEREATGCLQSMGRPDIKLLIARQECPLETFWM